MRKPYVKPILRGEGAGGEVPAGIRLLQLAELLAEEKIASGELAVKLGLEGRRCLAKGVTGAPANADIPPCLRDVSLFMAAPATRSGESRGGGGGGWLGLLLGASVTP